MRLNLSQNMFINRQMRSSLLVSFLWHLFCMSFVSIVFLPGGFKPRQCSSVYFLGSILRSPVSARHIPRAYKGDFVKLPPELDTRMDISPFSERQRTSLPAQRKVLNPDDFIDVDVSRENISSLPSPSRSAGPGEGRQIIFQPAFLNYPEVAMQQELKGDWAVFKIYISADGLVEQLICIQVSGSPEIDAALTRYIERWRFAPVAGLQGQWQTVKINLDLE